MPDFDDAPKGVYTRTIPELYRIMKPGAHLYIFFTIKYLHEITKLLEKAGFDVAKAPCVWVKDRWSLPGKRWDEYPTSRYEVFFFAKKTVEGQARKLSQAISNVFTYPVPPFKHKIHATEKPISLLKRIIKLSSSPGEIVFDPFAGSASTLIASVLQKRRSLGIEKSEEYFTSATGRLAQLIQDPDNVEAALEKKPKNGEEK